MKLKENLKALREWYLGLSKTWKSVVDIIVGVIIGGGTVKLELFNLIINLISGGKVQ